MRAVVSESIKSRLFACNIREKALYDAFYSFKNIIVALFFEKANSWNMGSKDCYSKILIYLSRACIASHILIYFLAYAIDTITLYFQHSTPPFRPCFELHDTGILLLLFIIFGCGACGFLFMCSSTKEEWKKHCILWAIIQLSGVQILSMPVASFLNWGHGAEASVLFYGGGLIATSISLIAAVAASYSQIGHSKKNILFLRLMCLCLLNAGGIMSVFCIEKI